MATLVFLSALKRGVSHLPYYFYDRLVSAAAEVVGAKLDPAIVIIAKILTVAKAMIIMAEYLFWSNQFFIKISQTEKRLGRAQPALIFFKSL